MKKSQKIRKIIVLAIIMLIISLSSIFYSKINYAAQNFLFTRFDVVSRKDNLLVHFIDVGQGDAIAINLPNNEVMVIDAGPKNNNVQFTNYIKENVLGSKTDRKIDYLILTHADSDHIGGAMLLMAEFEIGTVYLPKVSTETETYTELIEYVEENVDCEIVSSLTEFAVGNTDIEILGLYDYKNTNDSSTVVRLEFMNKKFLFTADVTSKVENKLISDYGDKLDCDVLKVAHHGSEYSTAENFVEAVSPIYSVISVGDNSYGHPTQTVMNNLSSSKILRTDADGNILFAVGDKYDLLVSTEDVLILQTAFDYRIYVVVVDLILVYVVLVVLLKKERQKKKV